MTVKVRHEATGDAFPADIDALDLPARLQANGAIIGWLTFRLPADLLPTALAPIATTQFCKTVGASPQQSACPSSGR
jgi:hypothetical protein